jgi:hypothetical protein
MVTIPPASTRDFTYRGDEYVQVTRDPTGNAQTTFLPERGDDLREIRMSCRFTGTCPLLTSA